ncbi:MAG: very short patch repair endonuclease [Candidatus Woesearchaeota archaeon]
MADIFTKKKRSEIMSKIRSKNTKIEVKLRKALWAKGAKGYRTHYKIIGKPDIVFIKKKIAIFTDSSFFHGYNWKVLGKVPPKGYWQKKIRKNMELDKKYTGLLKKEGWKVLRFWDFEINKSLERCIGKIQRCLQ